MPQSGNLEDTGGTAAAGTGQEGNSRSSDPLGAYTVNLTEQARAGTLDPLIGRLQEMHRTLEILCRRRGARLRLTLDETGE